MWLPGSRRGPDCDGRPSPILEANDCLLHIITIYLLTSWVLRDVTGQSRVAIYTRVSTVDQTDEGQERELLEFVQRRGWNVAEDYKDKISGIKNNRSELDRLLADAKKAWFTHVIVWRIDRLGRSVSHLLEVLETLKALDIKFVSLSEAIDTSTPAGLMVFTVLAAVAALE
jgi:DNA invertase Pin-like site-specific DNA recombinase